MISIEGFEVTVCFRWPLEFTNEKEDKKKNRERVRDTLLIFGKIFSNLPPPFHMGFILDLLKMEIMKTSLQLGWVRGP